ncbi:uncharacterized protein LOC108036211 [Drosophila biarmipes]|uniref:uncharacterized protein LOC108036211 n=1 Tax=Drosophila biarmipes TaxID=125945 RepID=UPI0007E78E57|nr:uncharacterized protein LOC108036211 [Drosophila biarmipes]
MKRGLFNIWQVLIIVGHIPNSMEFKYEFIMEDERIFSDCNDKPPGVLDITDLFDFTNTTFRMTESGVTLSGCKTVIWGIEPSDRVEIALSGLYFDRGTWQPTTLNVLIRDFCTVMFDPKQAWYDSYSKHIKNAAEVNHTCFRVKGSQIIFETYTIQPVFASGMTIKSGRYAMRFMHSAYDENEVVRQNKICYEIKGEIQKSSQSK